MRQLLQQQVEAAGSWQQLQQLLEGRKEQLTLKHISTMVVQVRLMITCISDVSNVCDCVLQKKMCRNRRSRWTTC
jgi:hypothetical protein